MTDLEKYETVNKCETVEALEAAITSFTDPETGLIQGRTRTFNGFEMASKVKVIVEQDGWPNWLTREFGIRQQALYLKHYHVETERIKELGILFEKPTTSTEGTPCLYIDTDWSVNYQASAEIGNGQYPERKYFFSATAAHKYVEMKRPCLSIEDCLNIKEEWHSNRLSLEESMKEYIKKNSK